METPDNFIGHFDLQPKDKVIKLIVTDYENLHYGMEENKIETVEESKIMKGDSLSYQIVKLEGIDTWFSSIDFRPTDKEYDNPKDHHKFLQDIRDKRRRKSLNIDSGVSKKSKAKDKTDTNTKLNIRKIK